jgi:hypothetical protein
MWLFLSVICNKSEADLEKIELNFALQAQARFFEIVGDLFGEFNKTGPVGIKNKVEGLRKALPEHWKKD